MKDFKDDMFNINNKICIRKSDISYFTQQNPGDRLLIRTPFFDFFIYYEQGINLTEKYNKFKECLVNSSDFIDNDIIDYHYEYTV